MAVIRSNSESRFRLGVFKGLNESPGGETELSAGEGTECRNFRVTREGGLEVRPGWKSLWDLEGPVEGLWAGEIGGQTRHLAAAGGKLWKLSSEGKAESLGNIGQGRCRFLEFGGRLYILTGKRYLVWTGYGQVTDVAGYRPMVITATTPEGSGTLLEEVNKLNGTRRGLYSPDGTAREFSLPEQQVSSVDYVRQRGDGSYLDFVCDKETGKVTLKQAPAKGINTLEIGWTKGMGSRGDIMACHGAEIYSGQSDKRVFVYGGTDNRAFYSGIDYDGNPTAEYFPEGNVLRAGSEESPITGMIRHYSKLLVFQKNGAYSVETGNATLADGRVIPTFFLRPIQRDMGNTAMGMVTLVNNEARTLWGGGVYQWKAGYNSYSNLDERTAKRISQRVEETLSEMGLENCVAFDDEVRGEWYLSYGERALVHNYWRDVWYLYDHFPARCFGVMDGELYFGTQEGKVCRVSRDYRSDQGEAIDAVWCSGAMDFDCGYRRKWGKYLWVTMKPESGSCVSVATRTDHRNERVGCSIRSPRMNYHHVNFQHWSYSTANQCRMKRVKPWSGNWSSGQILLKSHSASETATILALEGTIRKGRFQR